MKRLFIIAFAIAYTFVCAWRPLVSAQLEDNKPVFFTALRVGSTSEMVEIYNSSLNVDITGWYIEYSNVSGSNIKKIAELSGMMLTGSYLTFTTSAFDQSYGYTGNPMLYSGLADSGGFVRLFAPAVDGLTYEIVDEIGWTSNTALSADASIVSLPSTKTVHRCTDSDSIYAKRTNQQDFYTQDVPLMATTGNVCEDLIIEDDEEETDEVEQVNLCEGVRITEILPNPSGDDTGKEFVELYNSTTGDVSLTGCKLVVGAESYTFTNTEIPSQVYLVLFDSETGIGLINSKQETVYLVASDNTEVHEVTYIADLADDQSWASNGSIFVATFLPTPGAENTIEEYLPCQDGYERNPETNRCNKIVTVVASEQACALGYEINRSTGRCRKITNTTLVSCLPGQTRNPQTNRCKTTTQQTKSLTPCKVDEYRNPETNRCKKLDTGSELSPCPVGQSRSPDTNRCRINSEIEEPVDIQDLPAKQISTTGLPVSVISVGALSYAVYEWKPEIRNLLRRIRRMSFDRKK